MSRLRWKRDPRETGLASIGAPPRGWTYHDGSEEFASVVAHGGGWRREQRGWYWVAFGNDDIDIPYKNTCDDPCATPEEAKQQAQEYVKAHMRRESV